MKNTKIESPISLLISIVDRDLTQEIEKYLNEKNLIGGLAFMGKGTAESEIADIFGFGIVEREIVWSLINPLMSDKVLKTLNEVLELNKPARGIAMTIPASAASNLMLDVLGINY